MTVTHALISRSLLVTLLCGWAGMPRSAWAADAAAPQPAPLRVGAATAEFPADDKMQIGGNIDPTYVQGQEGKLQAVATVIEQPGSGKFAVVACDVVAVTRAMIDPVAERIEKSCGIPPAHLLVNATHTHHAPATVHAHSFQAEPEFIKNVEDGVVRAVEEANSHLTDNCRFGFKLEEEPEIGQNSRQLLADGMINWIGSSVPIVRPTGPFDPQLPVLSFRGPDNRLISVIYNHSTHTIGTLRPNVRSPSFYGLAAQALAEKWHAPVTFLEGASGSTHRMGGSVAESIEKLERDVTAGVDDAVVRPVPRIVAIKRPFTFHVRTFDEAVEDRKVSDYCAKHAPGMLDVCLRSFRQSRLELKPEQGKERESWVQVILLGDVALVGVPAELFTGLGMEVKRRSPFKETYIAELANDWIGYLPDREAHQLGGYQTWMGLHSFAEIGTGERMVDQVVGMLEELAGKAPRSARRDEPAPAKTRRVLYNLDGDSCMWTKKDSRQPVPVTAADMKTLVDEIAYPGSRVDTLLVNINAQVTYYPSQVGDMRGRLSPPAEREKWPAWEKQRFASVEAMFAQGVDPFALLLAEARSHGLEALLTYRMNDIHDFECLRCKLWQEHPELRLPDHQPGTKYYQPGVRAGFDFAHPVVRDYTFRLIEEAVQRYDADGIELDFVRAPIYFQSGTPSERIAMIDSLVERVRKMLDAEGAKRGRRLTLAARVLADPDECRQSGLDPVGWAERGWIDFVTISPYSGTKYDLPIKTWKQQITSVPVYACADSAGPAANYLLAADRFRQDGADGVYLFNFFTPREAFVEPPFEVLAHLGDPSPEQAK
ncbi:MAG TPA: family 10 glycosylhydrolase [Pirellulales bacterium]|nr:family 10 glycosylhydrolase [Pirellulales bacterium]